MNDYTALVTFSSGGMIDNSTYKKAIELLKSTAVFTTGSLAGVYNYPFKPQVLTRDKQIDFFTTVKENSTQSSVHASTRPAWAFVTNLQPVEEK
jgi:hypothetical protein